MSDSGRHRAPVSPGDVVAGKYRVEKVLGAGGMGVVVAATHIDLAQPVALKFIQPSAVSNNGSLERFMREARAAVRLRSEHVCRVLDVGRDADRPFMVLELLEGMDLAKLARHSAPLPVADAVEYVLQACDALVEAHGLGIVHRDLKPQNIFVTRRVNGTPLVKVLDFGIAKSVGAAAAGQMALTDSSAIIGSPLYMAPEQMRAPKTVDVRIDIWALGVILYELLGGQLPFDGETVTEVCIKVVNEEPTRLLELRPALDRKLVDVVMRCLEKDPEDRWQNIAQLAMELEPFSRSGRQGGFTRPWRSFEDTGDSKDAIPRVVLSAPGMAPASVDDTGPSTALTMPSAAPDKAGTPSVRRPGETAMLAATTPLPGAVSAPLTPKALADVDAPRALASTDTAWGEGTARQIAQPRTGSGRGVVLAIVGALAVAAGVGVVVGMRGRPPVPVAASVAPSDPGPPPATTVFSAPAAETPVAPAVTLAEAPRAPAPTTTAKPTRAQVRAPEVGRPAATAANVPSAPKPVEAPPKPVEAPPKPVEAPPKPAEPVPNGAPILR